MDERMTHDQVRAAQWLLFFVGLGAAAAMAIDFATTDSLLPALWMIPIAACQWALMLTDGEGE